MSHPWSSLKSMPMASPDSTTKFLATSGCSRASSSAVQVPAIGRDHAGLGIEAPDSVCLGIGDIDDIVGIEGDRRRPGQIDFQRGTISIEPMLTGADDRRNDAGLMVDFSNPVAPGITDIQIVLGVKRDVKRQIESGFATETFIAAVAGFPDAGKIVECAFLKIDAPDSIGS